MCEPIQPSAPNGERVASGPWDHRDHRGPIAGAPSLPRPNSQPTPRATSFQEPEPKIQSICDYLNRRVTHPRGKPREGLARSARCASRRMDEHTSRLKAFRRPPTPNQLRVSTFPGACVIDFSANSVLSRCLSGGRARLVAQISSDATRAVLALPPPIRTTQARTAAHSINHCGGNPHTYISNIISSIPVGHPEQGRPSACFDARGSGVGLTRTTGKGAKARGPAFPIEAGPAWPLPALPPHILISGLFRRPTPVHSTRKR